jgi:outer membrane biosynthesis protein TonB
VIREICVDTTGKVAKVTTVKGTGEPGLDAAWIEKMRLWVYAPYEYNGKAVPFCHVVNLAVKASDKPPAASASPSAAPSPAAAGGRPSR